MRLVLIALLLPVASAFAQGSGSSIVNCDKYPEAIGCSDFGTVGDAEEILDNKFDFQKVLREKKVPFNAAAQCPPDLPAPFALFGYSQVVSISFKPFCDFAALMRPMILLISAVFAGAIFMGAFKL